MPQLADVLKDTVCFSAEVRTSVNAAVGEDIPIPGVLDERMMTFQQARRENPTCGSPIIRPASDLPAIRSYRCFSAKHQHSPTFRSRFDRKITEGPLLCFRLRLSPPCTASR